MQAYSCRQIPYSQHKRPRFKAQVSRRHDVIKHQITAHTLGHGSRPLPITRQTAQHNHRQAESPELDSQQARTAAKGRKYTSDHVAISERLATGNVAHPVRRARCLQSVQTCTTYIRCMGGLAVSYTHLTLPTNREVKGPVH